MTPQGSGSPRPKIKLCGQTRLEDIRISFDLGADFCGVVVNVPSSPRSMDIKNAGPLFKQFGSKLFALTANADLSSLSEIARELKPAYFQLTADETPEFVKNALDSIGIPIFKSLHLPTAENSAPAPQSRHFLDVMAKYQEAGCAGFVLDSKNNGLYGGTGVKSDWNLANEIIRDSGSKVFLAGGITPQNISMAKGLNPYGLDLASGVETSPGIKSREKIESLFKAFGN
ncbi:MAG: phosphoribosylanthranilate isomerase [Nitrospinae bacterium]|nr:phosphoribosylanthranilate isomerase [Nitrospinota bacterium]